MRGWAATESRNGSPPRIIAIAVKMDDILLAVRKFIVQEVSKHRIPPEDALVLWSRLKRNESGDVINAAQILWTHTKVEVHWGESEIVEFSADAHQMFNLVMASH